MFHRHPSLMRSELAKTIPMYENDLNMYTRCYSKLVIRGKGTVAQCRAHSIRFSTVYLMSHRPNGIQY